MDFRLAIRRWLNLDLPTANRKSGLLLAEGGLRHHRRGARLRVGVQRGTRIPKPRVAGSDSIEGRLPLWQGQTEFRHGQN